MRTVIGWWAGGLALAVGVVVLGVLGLELYGHVRRLRRALDAAVADVDGGVRALLPPAADGRHRAG